MTIKPSPAPEPMPLPEVLTARMVAIGMAFAAEPARDADIESTVVFASIAGMVEDDLRVLSVLTTWLGVHHARVNAERLMRLVSEQPSERVRAYWASTEFQVKRRGEDPRFVASKLRVPSGTLRDRAADVVAPDRDEPAR